MASDNDLAIFGGSNAGSGILKPGRYGTDSPVSLTELKTRQVPLEWFEAVAITQGLCAAILEAGDWVGPAHLDPSNVCITGTGQVTAALAGSRTAAAVQNIAGILVEILPPRGIPLGLNSLIAKATSTPPVYASLEQLSQALSYFERPNRVELIRDIHRRWMSAPARPGGEVRAAAEKKLAAPQAQSKKPPAPAIWAAGIAVALLAIVGAFRLMGSFASRIPSQAPQLNTVVNLPSRVFKAVATEVKGAFGLSSSAVRDGEPSEASTAPAPVAPQPARPRTANAARSAPEPGAPVASSRASTADRSNTADTRAPRDLGQAGTVSAVDVDEQASVTSAEVYDSGHKDVTPPEPLSEFRVAAPPSVARDDAVNIELVVNARGTVESVKARRMPRTLGESLLLNLGLSAAKSWRFRPALKGGQPVSYRTFVLVRGS